MIIDCLSYYIMDLIIIFVYLYSPILIIVCFILINDMELCSLLNCFCYHFQALIWLSLTVLLYDPRNVCAHLERTCWASKTVEELPPRHVVVGRMDNPWTWNLDTVRFEFHNNLRR